MATRGGGRSEHCFRHHAKHQQQFIAYNANFNETQEEEERKYRATQKAIRKKLIRKKLIREESHTAEEKRLERLQSPELPPLSDADMARLAKIEHGLGYKFQSPRVLYVATYYKTEEIPTGPFKLAETNNMYSSMEEFATLGDALIALVVLDICQFSHYRRSMYLRWGLRSNSLMSCRSLGQVEERRYK